MVRCQKSVSFMDVVKLHKTYSHRGTETQRMHRGKYSVNPYYSPLCASVNTVPLRGNIFVQFAEVKIQNGHLTSEPSIKSLI